MHRATTDSHAFSGNSYSLRSSLLPSLLPSLPVFVSVRVCVRVCVCFWLCVCGASAMKVNAWICAPATASDHESVSRKSVRTRKMVNAA